MAETRSSTTVSTKLERIAKLAREMPQVALTTLAHHIDIDWLREAYRRTRKDGATGVDRQTADEYASNLEDNLRSLLERAKSGSYVAPPVRRVHIPKGGWLANAAHRHPDLRGQGAATGGGDGAGGRLRAEFSRLLVRLPAGRSAHQALRVVQSQTVKMAGRWVLEVDIRNFFETLDHGQLAKHRAQAGT